MTNKISAIVIGLILVAGTVAVASQMLRPALAVPPEGYVPLIPPEACSTNVPGTETLAICKKVEAADSDGDGIIEVGELITFTMMVTVTNPSANTWTNVVVKDNFGAELDVIEPCILSDATDTIVFTQTNNKSAKEKMTWTIGTLGPGETASLTCTIVTDLNPAEHQEYTECSLHEFNSGATLKFLVDGKQVSFGTGGITASVLTEDAKGDCDGDGFTDEDELTKGTDPHDPRDFPGCGGANTIDFCIDGDGIVTPLRGTFSVVWGDPLSTWPSASLYIEGIDAFNTPGAWVEPGSDLHLEGGPGGSCPTGIRNAIHDAGADCVILDLDGSLAAGGQAVDCDFEGAIAFIGCPPFVGPSSVKYHDSIIVNSFYDNGEDIILDVNGNGIFD